MKPTDLLKVIAKIIIVGIVWIGVVIGFTSCSTQKVVTVTEYRDRVVTDTVEALRVDSVYVAHYIKQQGDTIHQTDTIFKYKVLTKTETQTEYVRDSIPYPVEVIKEVRVRNGYDRFTSFGFWFLLVAVIIAVILWCCSIYVKRVYFHK